MDFVLNYLVEIISGFFLTLLIYMLFDLKDMIRNPDWHKCSLMAHDITHRHNRGDDLYGEIEEFNQNHYGIRIEYSGMIAQDDKLKITMRVVEPIRNSERQAKIVSDIVETIGKPF